MIANRILSGLAYFVIIVTGLKLGSSIILPFLMALLLFVIFLPFVAKLNKFGLPSTISALITFIIILVGIFLLGLFLTTFSNEIINNIPTYQKKFYQTTPQIIAFLEQFDISFQWKSVISLIEPAKIVNYTTTLFTSMGNVLVNILLTLALVVFLLLESSLISEKIFYFARTEEQKEKIDIFLKSINRYFLIKTFTSALTGLFIFILLKFFNLQYALLFAVLAFLLNYIPSIGSFVAAFPALFVAILQLNFVETSIIAIGYIVVNILFGNFIEPKIMGKDLGLSTFVVFISMVIWGWILGPFGMLLAVPLTITIKIICDNSENYHWVSVMLKDKAI